MARAPKRSPKTALTFSHGILLGGVLAMIVGAVAFENFQGLHNQPVLDITVDTKNAEVCFTPGRLCQKLILSHLSQAKKSIRIQAYSFTDREITELLVEKKKQGVDVQVILDKSNKKDPQGQLAILRKNQIPVRIDSPPGIAHNKIMIIDHETLITGSYNFSVSAYKRNAENVLVLKDKELVSSYIKNWQARWALSTNS